MDPTLFFIVLIPVAISLAAKFARGRVVDGHAVVLPGLEGGVGAGRRDGADRVQIGLRITGQTQPEAGDRPRPAPAPAQ